METEKNSCGQFGAGDEHESDSKRNTGFKRRLGRNAAPLSPEAAQNVFDASTREER